MSPQEQPIPKYSRAERDSISKKVLETLDAKIQRQPEQEAKQEAEIDTPAVQPERASSVSGDDGGLNLPGRERDNRYWSESRRFFLQAPFERESPVEPSIPKYSRFARDLINQKMLQKMDGDI